MSASVGVLSARSRQVARALTLRGLTLWIMTTTQRVEIVGVLGLVFAALGFGAAGALGLISPEPPAIIATLMAWANGILPWARVAIVVAAVLAVVRERKDA